MLYEKAFQKGLWEAVRAEKAYAPLLSALLEDYRAVSREGVELQKERKYGHRA